VDLKHDFLFAKDVTAIPHFEALTPFTFFKNFSAILSFRTIRWTVYNIQETSLQAIECQNVAVHLKEDHAVDRRPSNFETGSADLRQVLCTDVTEDRTRRWPRRKLNCRRGSDGPE